MTYVLARLVQDNGLNKEKRKEYAATPSYLCIAWFNSSKLLEHFEPSPPLRPQSFDL